MAKAKPSGTTNTIITIISIVLILVYIAMQQHHAFKIDIFYGQWGAYLMGVLAAAIAIIKHRNPVAWFAAGTWFVLAGIIIVLVLPKLHDRLCSYCQKGVSFDAYTCPYCQNHIGRVDV